MAEELKPCYCGNKAKIYTVGKPKKYGIQCPFCGFFIPLQNTKQKAINVWNRRADNGSKTD